MRAASIRSNHSNSVIATLDLQECLTTSIVMLLLLQMVLLHYQEQCILCFVQAMIRTCISQCHTTNFQQGSTFRQMGMATRLLNCLISLACLYLRHAAFRQQTTNNLYTLTVSIVQTSMHHANGNYYLLATHFSLHLYSLTFYLIAYDPFFYYP